MIKTTYKHFNTQDITPALAKLANCKAFPIKTAYNVSKIVKALKKEVMEASEVFMKLLDKYGEKDEKGLPKMDGNGPTIKPESKEEYEKEFKQFLEIEVEVNRNPIPIELLEPAELTPVEIAALEPMILIEE